ncbi:hypothetical protein ACFSSA_03960 [Luteolibacter algae]|uniref:Protein BatD n=1 Tax=Luteolibacter algae TaxID=454151 RepID=A0ABW5D483_9BACT
MMSVYSHPTFRALLCFFSLFTAIAAQPEIVLEWSKDRCEIGEVVKLKAKMRSDDVAGFELKTAPNRSVEWIGHESGVLRFERGIYVLEETLIAQPTRPGTVQLAKIPAEVKDGERLFQLELTVPPLEVSGYGGDKDDDFSPQPLPAESVSNVAKRHAGWIILVLLALGGGIVFKIRSNRSRQGSGPVADASPALPERLRIISECGTPPQGEIERLLAEKAGDLPPLLRQALERVAYAQDADWAAVCELIRKEVAR